MIVWVWAQSPTGLLLTLTGVSTNSAVVIFRVKVSCITSVDGIKLWLLTCLINFKNGDVIASGQSDRRPRSARGAPNTRDKGRHELLARFTLPFARLKKV